jgi:hypothetical protein
MEFSDLVLRCLARLAGGNELKKRFTQFHSNLFLLNSWHQAEKRLAPETRDIFLKQLF